MRFTPLLLGAEQVATPDFGRLVSDVAFVGDEYLYWRPKGRQGGAGPDAEPEAPAAKSSASE